MKTYKVTGCGVTLICQEGPSMLEWIHYMIFEKGGVPEVTLISKETLTCL